MELAASTMTEYSVNDFIAKTVVIKDSEGNDYDPKELFELIRNALLVATKETSLAEIPDEVLFAMGVSRELSNGACDPDVTIGVFCGMLIASYFDGHQLTLESSLREINDGDMFPLILRNNQRAAGVARKVQMLTNQMAAAFVSLDNNDIVRAFDEKFGEEEEPEDEGCSVCQGRCGEESPCSDGTGDTEDGPELPMGSDD